MCAEGGCGTTKGVLVSSTAGLRTLKNYARVSHAYHQLKCRLGKFATTWVVDGVTVRGWAGRAGGAVVGGGNMRFQGQGCRVNEHKHTYLARDGLENRDLGRVLHVDLAYDLTCDEVDGDERVGGVDRLSARGEDEH